MSTGHTCTWDGAPPALQLAPPRPTPADFFKWWLFIDVGPGGPFSGPRTKNGSGTSWGRGPDFWGRGLNKPHRRMSWSSSPRLDPLRSSGQNAPAAEERSAASPSIGGRQQRAHRGGRRTPLGRARRARRRPKKTSSFKTSEIWVLPSPPGLTGRPEHAFPVPLFPRRPPSMGLLRDSVEHEQLVSIIRRPGIF